MSLTIAGIGTAVPDAYGDQELALSIARQMCAQNDRHDRILRAIYSRSGVSKRHSVLKELSGGTSSDGNGFFIPERGSGSRGPSTAQRMKRYQTEILPLAAAASREALRVSSTSSSAITHLITVSCMLVASEAG